MKDETRKPQDVSTWRLKRSAGPSAFPYPDGLIQPDSPAGRLLGFTTKDVDPGSYLWKYGDSVYISVILVKPASQNKGVFRGIVERILGLGLAVKVPTPLPQMREILKRNGYKFSTERFSHGGSTIADRVEVWTIRP